ncbi:MAG TPA: discoidin domain-containing protein [Acidimicrobiales bacterium]|nr:discoidin domain-containing protein [Acidimicrobiales bacterium]
MTHERPKGRGRLAGSIGSLGSLAVAAAVLGGFLTAMGSPAAGQGGGTTTTTGAPGPTQQANCAATTSGTVLDRTGWAASTNAPSGSADAPANALDGDMTTRFSTDEDQSAGLYFEVNLGSAQAFDELEMQTPNSGNDYARGYDIEVYNGTSWDLVASCTGNSTPEIVSFPDQDAQYVAVVLTAANPSWWWSIDEFDLYMTPASTTTTTAATTTTTSASTTTTTPAAPTAKPPGHPGHKVVCRRLRVHRHRVWVCFIVRPPQHHRGPGPTTTTSTSPTTTSTSTTTTSTTTTSTTTTTVASTTTTVPAGHHRKPVCRHVRQHHRWVWVCVVPGLPHHPIPAAPTTTSQLAAS